MQNPNAAACLSTVASWVNFSPGFEATDSLRQGRSRICLSTPTGRPSQASLSPTQAFRAADAPLPPVPSDNLSFAGSPLRDDDFVLDDESDGLEELVPRRKKHAQLRQSSAQSSHGVKQNISKLHESLPGRKKQKRSRLLRHSPRHRRSSLMTS